VPNFLEAQVRAKVSRVSTDMRSVTVALEAYAVDTNKYVIPRFIASQTVGPSQSSAQFVPGGEHSANASGTELTIGLSSPIAYLTSSGLKDVFALGTFDNDHSDIGYQNIEFWTNHGIPYTEPAGNPLSLPTIIAGSSPPESYIDRYGFYILRSVGPFHHFTSASIPYDPTNGSVSRGVIYRTQKRAKNASSVSSL
jgi:hypothetical protein